MAIGLTLPFSDPHTYSSLKAQACIFDMDGVLVDTASYHFETWHRLAQELGFELSKDLGEQLKGISRRASLDIVLEAGGITATESEKSEMAHKKDVWFHENLEGMGREVVLPGVIDLLDELTEQGLPLAVGSASRNAATLLHKLDLAHYFISITDGNSLRRTKPHPEVFLCAARDLQTLESQCVIFEDSIKGVKAAKVGGFPCIGVGDPEVLKMADRVISGFEGLNFSQILG